MNTDQVDDRSGQPDERLPAVASNDRQTPKVSEPELVGDDLDSAAIMNALRGVIDPELGDNIVDLGMVKRLERSADRDIHITITLTTAGCPLRAQLVRDAKARVGSLPDIDVVNVHLGEMATPSECSTPTSAATRCPNLFGVDHEIHGRRSSDGTTVMEPLTQQIGDGALRIVSMGSIAGTTETEAIMWRGLMLNRAVQHVLEDVQWGDLGCLLIDMPPGTSDIQMGLARMLPRTDVVIVTTPGKAAQQVAARSFSAPEEDNASPTSSAPRCSRPYLSTPRSPPPAMLAHPSR